ncbi:hypothetical protein [Polaromonas sp.]|uniref:hypothetical protein n=1 Tax=Polaromonas sp. TaxID=1869339 RepID=UPI003752091B
MKETRAGKNRNKVANHTRPVTRAVALLAAVLLLSACAGTPYVRIDSTDSTVPTEPPTLPASIRHAEGVQRIYRDKLIELGDAERHLSNGLIGLGALALGLGISGSHSSAIRGVALIAGTAYTLGTFNTDKRRAAVYGAGIEALNCASGAVTPLDFNKATVTLITDLLNDKGAQQARVIQQVSAVLGLVASTEAAGNANANAVTAARATVVSAQAALARATEAKKAGDHLMMRHYRAGGDLRNAVKTIDAQVLNAIRSTEVDIRAVPNALAQLAGSSQIFSDASAGTITVPTPPDTEKAVRAAGDKNQPDLRVQLDAAVFNLQVAIAALDTHTARLAGIVASVDKDTAEKLKACKIEGLILPIAVSTGTVSFKEKTPGVEIVDISGGQRNTYRAEFMVRPHPGLSVRIPRSSDTLEIEATAQTVPGTYRVRVDDATLQSSQIVTVKITKAE